MIHLEDNSKRLLSDKLGVNKIKRDQIIRDVFLALPDSDDSVVFDNKCTEIEEKYQTELPMFVKYFNDRLRTAIGKHVKAKNSKSVMCWTNNNCESINHILKLTCNWTPQALPELIRKLQGIVRAQVQEVRRAVHGQGDFIMSTEYGRFQLQDMAWRHLNEEEKAEHIMRLCAFQPQKVCSQDIVTSKDGKLQVPRGQRLAKKPGQRKTPKNVKTSSKSHR